MSFYRCGGSHAVAIYVYIHRQPVVSLFLHARSIHLFHHFKPGLRQFQRVRRLQYSTHPARDVCHGHATLCFQAVNLPVSFAVGESDIAYNCVHFARVWNDWNTAFCIDEYLTRCSSDCTLAPFSNRRRLQ